MEYIPYGRQNISEEDIASVVDVLRSDFLTTGPTVTHFETALKNYCQSQHAVAVMNATVALHLACVALGVGQGDLVWTSPNTFLASANCARYCGADVDFVDIDPRTYNMSVQKLKEKLIQAKQKNRLPKVVIPVHFSGQSCDMREIKVLADQYGFYIIEDASHAIGGKYLNQPVGCCEYSDIAIFSFHPVKIMTTGEGGAIMTNDQRLADKCRSLRSHGMIRDAAFMLEESHGSWYYEQHELGFNYRITDIQCALGLSQLKRVDDFVLQRNQLAGRYNSLLKKLPVQLPYVMPEAYCSYHLYVIQLTENATKSRREAFDYLHKANIGVNLHYIPVHTQPYYQKQGFKKGDFPNAENYYQHAITLPLYASMTLQQQDYIAEQLHRVLI